MSSMVQPERKQSSLGIDKPTLEKLKAISAKARMTETEIIREFIEKLFQLITEGIPESNRLSLGSFVDLKSGSVRTCVAPIFFGIEEIPSELRKEVLTAFGYSTDGRFTDLREKKLKDTTEKKVEKA